MSADSQSIAFIYHTKKLITTVSNFSEDEEALRTLESCRNFLRQSWDNEQKRQKHAGEGFTGTGESVRVAAIC